ncbi:hypothetical protein AGR5A_Lc20125 [Agrobacterium genomosp. 5 str. CFBP 6626]|nr:hypothetical protein AGR5A_Lc20125 [Agrobacterium genomosp. 5 str. CFBP 6626]
MVDVVANRLSGRTAGCYETLQAARLKITLEKTEHVCNMNACSTFIEMVISHGLDALSGYVGSPCRTVP